MVDIHILFNGESLILPITILCVGISIYFMALGIDKLLNHIHRFNMNNLNFKSLGSDLKQIEKDAKKEKAKEKKKPKEIKTDNVKNEKVTVFE